MRHIYLKIRNINITFEKVHLQKNLSKKKWALSKKAKKENDTHSKDI